MAILPGNAALWARPMGGASVEVAGPYTDRGSSGAVSVWFFS